MNEYKEKNSENGSKSNWPIYLMSAGMFVLLVFSIFQYTQISSINSSLSSSGSSGSYAASSSSSSQDSSNDKMLKEMHPEQYAQLVASRKAGAVSSGAPGQVGGC